jgi:hypothetical protein
MVNHTPVATSLPTSRWTGGTVKDMARRLQVHFMSKDAQNHSWRRNTTRNPFREPNNDMVMVLFPISMSFVSTHQAAQKKIEILLAEVGHFGNH